MRPITEKIPKALILVNEQPFVHHQLSSLAKQGVTHVVFCIGYRGQMIREFVGSGDRWNLDVCYVDEGQELMGTAGAIRKAFDAGVLDDAFLVTYGDSYLPVHYGKVFEYFEGQDSPALMTVFQNFGKWDSSNVCFSNGKVTLYDKSIKGEKPAEMQYIDYGLSAFRRKLVGEEVEPGKKADLADLFHRLSVRGQLAGYEVNQRFYEIGSPGGLEDFKAFIGSLPKL